MQLSQFDRVGDNPIISSLQNGEEAVQNKIDFPHKVLKLSSHSQTLQLENLGVRRASVNGVSVNATSA